MNSKEKAEFTAALIKDALAEKLTADELIELSIVAFNSAMSLRSTYQDNEAVFWQTLGEKLERMAKKLQGRPDVA